MLGKQSHECVCIAQRCKHASSGHHAWVMQVDSASPRRQTYQVVVCGTTCLLSRAQNANHTCSWARMVGLHPGLLLSARLSATGKVAANLVFMSRLCSSLVCPGSLTHYGMSTQSRSSTIAIGSTDPSMVIAIEVYLPPFTSLFQVALLSAATQLYMQAGTCIRSMQCFSPSIS